MKFDLPLNQMLSVYCQLESKMAIKVTCRLYSLLHWNLHLRAKYCDDTREEQQLARATEHHIRFKNAFKVKLAQQCTQLMSD